jgi:hypothetical protein
MQKRASLVLGLLTMLAMAWLGLVAKVEDDCRWVAEAWLGFGLRGAALLVARYLEQLILSR